MMSTIIERLFTKSSSRKTTPVRKRQLRLETLENRELLSVNPTEFAAIRSDHADLNLSANMSDYNVIEITAAQLSDTAIRSAIADAGKTTENDLIVLRTTATQNKITLGGELLINFDASQYGSITIVGLGTNSLTLDANQQSRVFNITHDGINGNHIPVVGLAGLTIINGIASYGGGGIANIATLTVTNCTLAGNSAYMGGGIYNSVSTAKLTITNSTLTGNTASSSGSSYSYGGGIYNDQNGKFTVTNCKLIENSSSYVGGGIYSESSSSQGTITNSTLTGNTASYWGGGIFVSGSGTYTITNSTLADNNSDGRGSGIYYESIGKMLTLYNTIVVTNGYNHFPESEDFYDIYVGDVQVGSTIFKGTIQGYNNLTTFTDWDGTSGNNYVYDANKPMFVDAANGNYRLAANSQAINKGDNSYVSGITKDLAGNARIQGSTVDIGAYEYTIATAAPANPVAAVSQSGNYAKLSWNAVNGAEKYAVYRSLDNGKTWNTVNANVPVGTLTITDTAAPLNKNILYAVTAVNSAGSSGYTAKTFIGIPQTTVQQLNHDVNISWTAIDGLPATTSYSIYRSSDNGVTWKTVSTNISAGTTSFTYSNAVTGTWSYAVLANVGSTSSGYVGKSIAVSAVGVPIVTVSSSGNYAKLSWGAISEAAKYAVYRSLDNGTTWNTVNSNVPAGTLTITDTAAPLNKNILYAVTAVNSAGASSGYTAKTFIGIPQTTVKQLNHDVNISWTAISGQPAITSYSIYRSSDNGVTWKTVSANVPAGTTSFTYSNAVTGTWSYAVLANVGSTSSGYVGKSITVTAAVVPAKPAVTVTSSGNYAKLSWAAVSGAAKYTVYRSVDNGKTWNTVNANVPAGTLTITDTAAPLNKNILYAVTAVNSAGTDSGYIPATFIGIPQATLQKQGNNVNISWTAISGLPAITSYSIYRSSDNGKTWKTVNANVPAGTTSFTYSNAATGTWTYAVLANVGSTSSGYVGKNITV